MTSRGFTYLREQAADAESLVVGIEEQLTFFHAVAFGRVEQVSSLVLLRREFHKIFWCMLIVFSCVQNHGRKSTANNTQDSYLVLLSGVLAPVTFGG